MPVTVSAPGKSFIPSLNGLRALSIIIVFLNHFAASIYSPLHSMGAPWTFFSSGGMGVNIFFVISGYLITKLLMQENEATYTVSLKNFYIRRTLRIFPAYYFLLSCYFILQLMHLFHLPLLSWIACLTYTRYFFPAEWATGHLWSLSVEEHFYLLWPLIFKLRKNSKYNFLIVAAVVVPVIRVLFVYCLHYKWMDKISFFQRADAIIIGCLLAIHYERISLFTDRLVKKSRFFFFLPVIVLFLLYLANTVNNDDLPQPLSILAIALGDTFGSIANLAIMLLVVISINYKTAWYRFLNLRFISFIGKLSYSIYLWMQVFLADSTNKYAPFPLNVLGLIAMALFSYYVIERPFLKLKKKFEVA